MLIGNRNFISRLKSPIRDLHKNDPTESRVGAGLHVENRPIANCQLWTEGCVVKKVRFLSQYDDLPTHRSVISSSD